MSLYLANSGRISCHEHGGTYLRSHLRIKPKAKWVNTPLDHWERLTEFEAASLRNDLGIDDLCEGCRKDDQ